MPKLKAKPGKSIDGNGELPLNAPCTILHCFRVDPATLLKETVRLSKGLPRFSGAVSPRESNCILTSFVG